MFQRIKEVVVILISVLIAVCKISNGVAPFGLAMIGALGGIGIPLIVPFVLIFVTTYFCLGRLDST